MRTRTLLVAAALTAAGLATSLAQSNVYSINIVGYVNVVYPAGYTLAANPLKNATNTVDVVFANAPVNASVTKFTGGAFGSANVNFGGGFWGNNAMTVVPGEGFFLRTPSAFTNTYVGEVVQFSTNNLPVGYSIVGSVYPASGAIDTNLMLVPTVNDSVTKYVNPAGYGAANVYFGAGFWGGGNPTLSPAEAVFYNNKKVSANSWIQSFP